MFGKNTKTSKNTSLFDASAFRTGFNRGTGEALGGLAVGAVIGGIGAAIIAAMSWLDSREKTGEQPVVEASTPTPVSASPFAG